ncbi:glycogen synthase [Desulfopila sp. IMCC35008]|uniref:glycogen synthase n=1 Tax=Desulfopila sp. IMCC35008 TaxID=2653858 RepID=UPI0013D2A1E9|nr:glycogen/starch synthase [Desulfopila sp. IMCC35008]
MNIVMVASENDALPGGKVGGIGDVVRDIPPALGDQGHRVNVITPDYGVFSRLPGAELRGSVEVLFAGKTERVVICTVPAKTPHHNVLLWVLEHPLFAGQGGGAIYCDDPADRPFATDATKFALFCTAVCQAIADEHFGKPDVLHLHDWHAAMVAILLAFDPQYHKLQRIHSVFTIHNLALQGIRPLSGDESSLEAWFPNLKYDHGPIHDPRVSHCINLMRSGLNLCRKVHAVSPSYATEIITSSNHDQGYFGGEGLEKDLQQAAEDSRLYGILNGCDYPPKQNQVRSLSELISQCERELLTWIAAQPSVESAHLVPLQNLTRYLRADSSHQPFVVTSVGRVTEQKVLILCQEMANGQSALEHLLDMLGEDGIFLMLGSGDRELELFLTRVAARKANFIFLRGYSESLANALYEGGDLFLMPSSFEPCGISQMLAMRAGQPCLVHGVGGLRDTVKHNENGFVFSGNSLIAQAMNMLKRCKEVIGIHDSQLEQWQVISKQAARERFLWSSVAKEYVKLLYRS